MFQTIQGSNYGNYRKGFKACQKDSIAASTSAVHNKHWSLKVDINK